MPWRTEPEIGATRQAYLAQRRATQPDVARGIYPFRDEGDGITLSRADVEWLLATHESRGVMGPVVWHDEEDKPDDERRSGLDLRGANLRRAALAGLPLARTVGGLHPWSAWSAATAEQRAAASVHLEGADLSSAGLRGALLAGGHLEGARLIFAGLDRAVLQSAHLEGADLKGARLARADLTEAHAEGADLTAADLTAAQLVGARLQRADLGGAQLPYAWLMSARLAGARLGTHLDHVALDGAHLEGERVAPDDLLRVRRWVEDFPPALPGADLRRSYFEATTKVERATFGSPHGESARLADVQWGAVNLTVVDWAQVSLLGDEQAAREGRARRRKEPRAKARATRRSRFEEAVRANRQLATALRGQGLHEQADRFTYRAQVCQRQVLRLQGITRFPAYLGSLLLWALSGYGYRIWRIFAVYLLTLVVFAAVYYVLGLPNTQSAPQLQTISDAFLVSLTAIHGRVFLEQLGQYSAQAWVAAIESVAGIVIEGVFVAMLIQRFFAR